MFEIYFFTIKILIFKLKIYKNNNNLVRIFLGKFVSIYYQIINFYIKYKHKTWLYYAYILPFMFSHILSVHIDLHFIVSILKICIIVTCKFFSSEPCSYYNYDYISFLVQLFFPRARYCLIPIYFILYNYLSLIQLWAIYHIRKQSLITKQQISEITGQFCALPSFFKDISGRVLCLSAPAWAGCFPGCLHSCCSETFFIIILWMLLLFSRLYSLFPWILDFLYLILFPPFGVTYSPEAF